MNVVRPLPAMGVSSILCNFVYNLSHTCRPRTATSHISDAIDNSIKVVKPIVEVAKECQADIMKCYHYISFALETCERCKIECPARLHIALNICLYSSMG